jgi:hypothetical protein
LCFSNCSLACTEKEKKTMKAKKMMKGKKNDEKNGLEV